LWVFVLLIGAGLSARALEIPLKHGGRGGSAVAVVDMEKIFQEFPETKKARADYYAEVERRRRDLAQMEIELEELGREIPAPSAGTAAGVALTTGTPLAASLGFAVPPRAPLDPSVLADKREALEKARREAAQALTALEDERSARIMGKLQRALTQLAEEKGIALVVDKSTILYGEAAVDLTDALSRRVRGLPEEER
jgi:Skp family chaperone for outer membrane proteins